jgi:hypothetical protein
MKHSKMLLAWFVFAAVISLAALPASAEPVSAEQLVSEWNFHGNGLQKVERNMFYMKEDHGSG